MTVNSLWSILEEAGCGKCIGVEQFIHQNGKSKTEKYLAVDLSIWICEALSSSVLKKFHVDPALYLVYQRTIRLLKMGMKLIFVVEGKRRKRNERRKQDVIDSDNNKDTISSFQLVNRRSGTLFWKSCRSCEHLLNMLGVIVLHAKAEGEALCALLNLKGIVHGVITNDGDTFLYGASTLYTNFSIENLDCSRVIRFDSSDLRAFDEKEERMDIHGAGDNMAKKLAKFNLDTTDKICSKKNKTEIAMSSDAIILSREDLISFALLTGSDLVGHGIPTVGSKKAIRFINACKELHPLTAACATLDELKCWSNSFRAIDISCTQLGRGNVRCCSICMHPGDKSIHQKYGCEDCGTVAGEACFFVTKDERFRRTIRQKAMSMSPPFAGWEIIKEYYKPNQMIIPAFARNIDSFCIPGINDFFKSDLIVKGQTLECSREHFRKTLPKLVARITLFNDMKNQTTKSDSKLFSELKSSCERDSQILPLTIVKRATHESKNCFEIHWIIDGEQCGTYEWETVVEQTYPHLVQNFQENERKEKQLATAQLRNDMFLGRETKRHSRARKRHRSFDRGLTHENDKDYTVTEARGEDTISLVRSMTQTNNIEKVSDKSTNNIIDDSKKLYHKEEMNDFHNLWVDAIKPTHNNYSHHTGKENDNNVIKKNSTLKTIDSNFSSVENFVKQKLQIANVNQNISMIHKEYPDNCDELSLPANPCDFKTPTKHIIDMKHSNCPKHWGNHENRYRASSQFTSKLKVEQNINHFEIELRTPLECLGIRVSQSTPPSTPKKMKTCLLQEARPDPQYCTPQAPDSNTKNQVCRIKENCTYGERKVNDTESNKYDQKFYYVTPKMRVHRQTIFSDKSKICQDPREENHCRSASIALLNNKTHAPNSHNNNYLPNESQSFPILSKDNNLKVTCDMGLNVQLSPIERRREI